jgi:nitroreductase
MTTRHGELLPDVTTASGAVPQAFVTQRFSPMRFETSDCVTNDQVDVLLDAARRAPSAGNSQPWAFIVGRRGDAVHERLVQHLAGSASAWAGEAAVLMANLAQLNVEGSDLEYSEFARYDLGQAVAHLTFQAHGLGLSVHQFRAFDRIGLSRAFDVPAHWEITSMAAIGTPADSAQASSGAGTTRDRRTLEQITWARARA